MTHQIDEQVVRSLASCAHIALSDEEVTIMAQELTSIVENLAPITEYELEGVEPSFYAPGAPVNIMREDVPEIRFSQNQALFNASQVENGYFVIPPLDKGDE